MNPIYTRRQCLSAAAAALALHPISWGAGACDVTVPMPMPDTANATDWTPNEQQVLPRRNATQLAVYPAWRHAFATGWSKFRSLPASNNIGWLAQAGLHQWACSAPMDVHQSDAFLIWHRGFMYFHERILRSLVGDAFRLPYWQWDNPGPVGSPLPSAYTDGDMSSNPLFEACRGDKHGGVGGCVDMKTIFEQPHFLRDPDNIGFQPKLQGVHGAIHISIPGYMAALPKAALDPLFYAHHVNCDKLIVDWQSLGGDRSWPSSLAQQPYYFYDENGRLVRVLGSQLMDTAKLGYCYGPPASTVCLGPSPDVAEVLHFGGTGDQVHFTSNRIGAVSRTKQRRISLLVNGIRTDRTRPRLLWFFANRHMYNFPLNQSNPGFLGSVGIFPEHHGAPKSLRDEFDVTRAVNDMLRSGVRVLSLTIAELDPRGGPGLRLEPLRAESYRLRIQGTT